MANFVRRASSQGIEVRIEACGVEYVDAELVHAFALFMSLVLACPAHVKATTAGALVGLLEGIKRTLVRRF